MIDLKMVLKTLQDDYIALLRNECDSIVEIIDKTSNKTVWVERSMIMAHAWIMERLEPENYRTNPDLEDTCSN